MTVSAQTNNATFLGNGVTTAFPLPFRFFNNGDIYAYTIDPDTGASTPLTIGVNYTLAGAGEPEVDGNAQSVLTMTAPLPNLVGLYVERVMEQVQETDIVNQGEFFASTHEDVFDRLTMLIQQSGSSSKGAIRVAIGDPEPARLPSAITRANQLMGFNSLGDPIPVAPVSGDIFDFALNLANATNPAMGAGMVGYRRRTVHARLDDAPSIKDYSQPGFGIPGFGVQADDEAAFDAAIAALNAGTIKALHVVAGTYLLGKTYNITTNGSTIFGDGVDVSIIKRTDGSFGDSFVFARSNPATQQLAGVNIHDLTFWCQADMSTGGVLRFRNCTRVFMSNVFVRNCFKGIWLEGIRDSRFHNIEIIQGEHYTVDRTGAYHIHIGAPANSALKSTETFFSNFNMTTAGNAGDVNGCIRIDGDLDGLWFCNSHWFGGKTAGVIISGDAVPGISGLTFVQCWFDQFTERNLIIQGTTTNPALFRLITFIGCRFWGGTTNNVSISNISGVKTVLFSGCEFGQTLGQGVQIGAGQVTIIGCQFAKVNQSATAGGYALQTTGSTVAGTNLIVKSCDFECSNLYYGIMLNDIAVDHHLHDCSFHGQGGSFLSHILYSGDSLIGTCGGHRTALVTAGNIAAATTVQLTDIAIDAWNLTGATATINLLKPYWHGRRLSIKASTAIQNMTQSSGAGSLRNRAGAATTAIAVSDVYQYEYRGDSFRWHQLG